MRRTFIGKRSGDKASSFANAEVHLLEPRLGNKHHAVTNVDPVGVIEHFTFADIAHETGRWAHLLRANGLQPGDRVVLLAGREWAWRCALLGVLRAGGVAVPCPASLPVEEIRAIAASADAGHLISIPARPDLEEAEGLTVLDADAAGAVDFSTALREPAHESRRDDVALILYARRADGLRGAVHTHASLIAQADAGGHWLGVGEDEPVWCTAPGGSPESIWLLLAGWHEGANVVNVDLELEPEAMLELLGRLDMAAIWFSDAEYDRLASAGPAAWINGSINRAFVSDESASGAAAFANAVGTSVAAVLALADLGVVATWPAGAEGEDMTRTAWPLPGIELAIVGEQGTRLPAGVVGDVVVRGETPSRYAGTAGGAPPADGWVLSGWRGSLDGDGLLRLTSRSTSELEPVEARIEAERRRRKEEEARELAEAAEAERARREAAAAEERRRAEARQRAEERRRAEEEAKRRAEQEAREREQAAAAAQAEREAEERRRAEEEHRREENGRRQEAEARRRAEQEARERERAEAAAVAEREAAAAAERRRAVETQREEERRRAHEEAKRRAEQQAREREQAAAAARAEREAAERRRAEAAEKAAVSTNAEAGVVQPKTVDATGPASRHPGARAWQVLTVVLLLVVGALLAAYFLKPPERTTATRTVTVPTASASKAATKPLAKAAVVPSVLGLKKIEALSNLTAAGLGARIRYVVSSAPAGQVVSQSPAGGFTAKGKVLLTVSRPRSAPPPAGTPRPAQRP